MRAIICIGTLEVRDGAGGTTDGQKRVRLKNQVILDRALLPETGDQVAVGQSHLLLKRDQEKQDTRAGAVQSHRGPPILLTRDDPEQKDDGKIAHP